MAMKECRHSGLDVFSVGALHTAIEDTDYVECRSLAALNSDGPVEFSVPGGTPYLDLANTYLRVKAKVTNADGTAVDAGHNVVPVNLLLHSMFSDVTVYVGGVQVSTCSGAYPYQAYLQTLLSYGQGPKHSHLEAALWYQDTAAHFDKLDGDDNEGSMVRRVRAAESKTLDMVGRLHSELFHQSKFLLNHLDVRVKLTRSKDEFVLMSSMDPAPRFKLELVDVGLFVKKVSINPAISLSHEKILEKHNAKYPVTKLVMRVYTAPANSMNFSVDNMFLDHLPNRVVLGFVKASSINGSLKTNPFKFEHCDINSLSLYHQGKQIPTKGLQPDFDSHQCTRSFMSLYTGTNTAWNDHSCGVRWRDYPRGYTLWVFDLTTSQSHAPEAIEVSRAGPLRFECKFKKALGEAYNLIVYSEFQNRIEITRSREVVVL